MRTEYGGLKVDQAKRLKDLERENARLKRLLADAGIAISIQPSGCVYQRVREGAWVCMDLSRYSGDRWYEIRSSVDGDWEKGTANGGE